MENDQINRLIRRYLDGTVTEDERRTIETHFLSYLDREEAEPSEEHIKRSFTDSYKKIRLAMGVEDVKRGKIYPLRWALYAAATLLVFGIASVLIVRQQKESFPNEVTQIETKAEKIRPGSNRAKLISDRGRVIELSEQQQRIIVREGEIAYVDGTRIVNRQDHSVDKSYTLETPKGGTYQVRLPDGTEVWLNAATRINYAADFGKGKSRKVQLHGEAYFEVAKDKSRPFLVETKKEHIEVLGTRFNVNSYTDEAIARTTLLEGSVKINGDIVLNPGDQAVVSQNGAIAIQQVNTNGVVAWKNDKFVFQSEHLRSVMRQIERWYNVEIVYERSVSNKTFTGTVSRFEDISKLLQIITCTSDVKFKIEGKRITVMPAS